MEAGEIEPGVEREGRGGGIVSIAGSRALERTRTRERREGLSGRGAEGEGAGAGGAISFG